MRKRLVLASTSPRRVELMAGARLRVEVVAPNCPELSMRGESPRQMVRRLAREKAAVVAQKLLRSRATIVILAADTTVVAPGGRHILGKPRDVRDAERMLKLLSGRTHEVLTGYCLLQLEAGVQTRERCRVVRSKVTMRRLDSAMIRAYVAGGEPMDKAGSYAAQGFGMNWISSIQGSYTNVVGLPMSQLLEDLDQHFAIRPELDV